VLVEALLREALIRLNPEIAEKPDRADEVIYKLRAILLSVHYAVPRMDFTQEPVSNVVKAVSRAALRRRLPFLFRAPGRRDRFGRHR
jgi:hypothetical protein